MNNERASPLPDHESRFRDVCFAAMILCMGHCVFAADEVKPNVVLILADDLGYGDLGCYGSDTIRTPNLDRLAQSGMRFTDFHMASSVCSASRAALLTGCYPLRVGIPGVLSANVRIGIHADEELLPELLKRNGYATAIFGKWHLGNQKQFWPLKNGFNEWLGTVGSNDMGKGKPTLEARRAGKAGVELVEQDSVIEVNPEQSQLTRRYTEKAIDFIARHKTQPFFLYVPHNMPHTPLFASPQRVGKSKGGLYGDVVEEIDWSVGQILDSLKTHGLTEKTIVIFTSDNGPWLIFGNHGGSAGRLRGGKKQTFEGGHRVPMIVRWPGRVPAGTLCTEPAVAFDLLPTLAACTGCDTPRRKIDGKDISSLIFGAANARTPHEFFAYYYQDELRAIRSGNWKMQFAHTDHNAPALDAIGNEGVRGGVSTADLPMALFDLATDIAESRDVSKKHPEIVTRLSELANQIRGELGDSITKTKGRFRRAAGTASGERSFESSDRLTLGTDANLSASVRIADVDHDKDLDVIVANGRHWPQQNFLLINQGRAQFSVQRRLGEELATTYATELGDLDGDGDLDIAVGNDMAPNRVFLNDGSGRFDPGAEFGEISSVRSLTLADIDGDKDLDILETSRGRQNQFYLNDGNGRFDSGQLFGKRDDSTIDVAVADLNLDGHPDLVLANRDGQQNYVLLNDGHTKFARQIPFGTGKDQTRAVAVADIDGDGKPDLVVGNIGQPNAVYLGDGKAGVRAVANFGRKDGKTYSLAVADMDNDGDLDLIAGNVAQQNAVFFNLGDGKRYREVRFGDESHATYGLDTGDLNGDGFEDIAVANSGSRNRIFLNRSSRQ
ncbi:MAG: sulfatase-like hydrolase/transferase [Planctomycetales bacterium]|jgi:arylsulfatase A